MVYEWPYIRLKDGREGWLKVKKVGGKYRQVVLEREGKAHYLFYIRKGEKLSIDTFLEWLRLRYGAEVLNDGPMLISYTGMYVTLKRNGRTYNGYPILVKGRRRAFYSLSLVDKKYRRRFIMRIPLNKVKELTLTSEFTASKLESLLKPEGFTLVKVRDRRVRRGRRRGGKWRWWRR